MTTEELQKVIEKEIASFEGLSWYDGLSWLPSGSWSEGQEEFAYRAVFAELKKRALAAGMKDPYPNHAGNGHYWMSEK